MTTTYLEQLDADAQHELCKILSWAFGFPVEDAPGWLLQGGLENVRGIRSGERLAGGLLTLPMGQYYGGRRVQMVGIAGVAIAPELRGTGYALTLMQHTMRELHERGVSLSTLYPASVALYRKAGYELAGSLYDIHVEASRIGVQHRGATFREIVDADQATLRQLYRSNAQTCDGFLDRSDYIWGRVRAPRKRTARGTLILIDNEPAGYVFMTQQRLPNDYYDVRLTDLAYATPEAARTLLSFLAQHSTMANHVHWTGSSIDPLIWQMPERSYKIALREHWMTRICHVTQALTERGYPEHLDTVLHLELHDPMLPEQSGNYTLRVKDGQGLVERGGTAGLRLDNRALAALYTGFMSPTALAGTGHLAGDKQDLQRAAAIFAGPAPCMPDFF